MQAEPEREPSNGRLSRNGRSAAPTRRLDQQEREAHHERALEEEADALLRDADALGLAEDDDGEEDGQLRRVGVRAQVVGGVRAVALSDIDDADQSLQFRFSSKSKRLKASLAKDGQLVPVRLTGSPSGNGYRVIDGFRRIRAARERGWETIQAHLYPWVGEDQLRRMSFVMNVTRRNLGAAEQANAMHLARLERFSNKQIAELFQVSERTVERALALPEHILRIVDGRVVTMAHAKVLRDAHERTDGGLMTERVEELAEAVRCRKLTAKQLGTELTGRCTGKGGRPATFVAVSDEEVRYHARRLRVTSKLSHLHEARRAYALGLQALDGLIERAAADGNQNRS